MKSIIHNYRYWHATKSQQYLDHTMQSFLTPRFMCQSSVHLLLFLRSFLKFVILWRIHQRFATTLALATPAWTAAARPSSDRGLWRVEPRPARISKCHHDVTMICKKHMVYHGFYTSGESRKASMRSLATAAWIPKASWNMTERDGSHIDSHSKSLTSPYQFIARQQLGWFVVCLFFCWFLYVFYMFLFFVCHVHLPPWRTVPSWQTAFKFSRERWVMVMGDTETEDMASAWHLGSIFHLFFSANPSAKIGHSMKIIENR